MKTQHVGLVLFLMVATSVPSWATNISFTGGPGSGTDPLGHSWEFDNDAVDIGSWGIPGLGEGQPAFLGDDFVTDFHITFELPDGVGIDSVRPPSDFFATRMQVTRVFPDFSSITFIWDRQFMDDDTVWFFAPSGTRMLPGDLFFVNVIFDAPLPSGNAGIGVPFSAEWTMTVPEPTTLSLLLLSLFPALPRRPKRLSKTATEDGFIASCTVDRARPPQY
jgi:hypothetical protein